MGMKKPIPHGPHFQTTDGTSLPIIWRRHQVETATGYSRSTLYLRIAQGLWPKPVRIGVRAVGWPASEVAAMNAARIAGEPDSEIVALVKTIEAGRHAKVPDRVRL